jgi:hypothetical protein
MVEGEQFLIQSPSPDWVRRKISLSDLRDSAVDLILEEGNTAKKFNQINYRYTTFNRSWTAVFRYKTSLEFLKDINIIEKRLFP